MTNSERTRARFTRRIVFHETPAMAEQVERWADEGATSQASVLRLALREFFRDSGAPQPRVG
jgi:hypothetical protein